MPRLALICSVPSCANIAPCQAHPPINHRKAHTARRAAITGPNGWLNSAMKARVRVRDGHACVLCGARGPLEVDHIVPLLAGGAHTEANMRTLCRACNQARNRRKDEGRGA